MGLRDGRLLWACLAWWRALTLPSLLRGQSVPGRPQPKRQLSEGQTGSKGWGSSVRAGGMGGALHEIMGTSEIARHVPVPPSEPQGICDQFKPWPLHRGAHGKWCLASHTV